MGTQGYFNIRGLFAYYTAEDLAPIKDLFSAKVPQAGGLASFWSPPALPIPGFGPRARKFRSMYVYWSCWPPGDCVTKVQMNLSDWN